MLVQSIHYMSASELAALIRTRALSPVEVIKETLDRIEAVNALINAFVAMRADETIAEAKDLEARMAHGRKPGPLAFSSNGVKAFQSEATPAPLSCHRSAANTGCDLARLGGSAPES